MLSTDKFTSPVESAGCEAVKVKSRSRKRKSRARVLPRLCCPQCGSENVRRLAARVPARWACWHCEVSFQVEFVISALRPLVPDESEPGELCLVEMPHTEHRK